MGKTLITGITGLVGSQINGNIIGMNSSVCDLRDKSQTDEFIRYYSDKSIHGKNAINKIIHCAGKVGGIGSNINYMGEYFYDNIMINTNIIESAKNYGIEKFVGFLSTCIFPDNIDTPLNEKHIHYGPPHISNYGYAYSKRMIDIQIRAYREQYGLKYTSVIPTNIYGPNDNFNINNGHVIPSIIHKCYLARENKTNLTIWGSGKPLREFIYSKDVAFLSNWVLENYDDSEPIILSTSEQISISDIVELIVKTMNFKGRVIFDKEKPDGQLRKKTDNTKLKNLLPNYQFTPFETGIIETIDWFEKNINNIRK